jgi:hypothetical protein
MKKVINVLIIVSFLFLGSFLLSNFEMNTLNNVSADNWIQESSEDFDLGENVFAEIDDGTISLTHNLVETWNTIGQGTNDAFSYSTDSAGDINGDGYDDIIVGAYYDSSQRGKVYVWYGSKTGLKPSTDAGSADWSTVGEGSSDYFGFSVSGAGDVNGDGYDDVVIGAFNDNSVTGKVYIWYGSAAGLKASTDAGFADWSIAGAATNNRFGYSVSGVGDINGDGYDDITVGAPYNNSYSGSAYLWYGSSSGLSTGTDANDADLIFRGESSNNYFGHSVAGAGDINDDGYDDMIISAPYYTSGTGRIYVWHGSQTGPNNGTDASSADWMVTGETISSWFGYTVASAGDLNADGYYDIITGAYNYNGALGKAFVWYGSVNGLNPSTDAGDSDWSTLGENAQSSLGMGVSSAGDVNNDGYDDIVMGAYRENSFTGSAYFCFGSSTGLIDIATAAESAWLGRGEGTNDYYGRSVSLAGDVNGDGYSEFIVNAYNDNTRTGKMFVYSYSNDIALSYEPEMSKFGEAASNYFGYSTDSAGDVNGDGYDDIIVSAYGYSGFLGKVYVWYGSSTGISSGSADWTIIGEDTIHSYSTSIAGAGDINGDGFDDIIVGAYGYSSSSGRVYIWYGSSSGLSTGSNASSADLIVDSPGTGYRFGRDVSGAGDVNGDGYDDVIISAYGYSSYTGRAYVYYGSSSGLQTTGSWYRSGPASGSYFGEHVDAAGDVNGDGFDDVIISADNYNSNTGRVYVFYGSSTGLTPYTDWYIDGDASFDYFGYSVSGAGDVNGDGYDDIIAGSLYHDYGDDNSGSAFVWYGSAEGLRKGTTSSDSDWNATAYFYDERFGYDVNNAGDINGDGYDDILIHAIFGNSRNGYANIWYGGPDGLGPNTNSNNADWSKDGVSNSDYFGYSSGCAGDVNGDGIDDLIISAYQNDDSASNAGKVTIWHGHGYIRRAVYESSVYDIEGLEGVEWLKLSWTPEKQPYGTTVKAQIATSNDGISWTWQGPSGISSDFYTRAKGERIFVGEQAKFLKVRFYLESNFGSRDEGIGARPDTRTPTIDDFDILFEKFEKPVVKLNSPNGGEDWMKDDYYPITWKAHGELNSTSITLLYSTDNGATWSKIIVNTANTGHYNWTVPNVDTPSALIKVIVTDIYGNSVSDTSDASFAIDPPPVQVNGGSTYQESFDDVQTNEPDSSSEPDHGPGSFITTTGDQPGNYAISWYLMFSIILATSILVNIYFLIHNKKKTQRTSVKQPTKQVVNTKRASFGKEKLVNRNLHLATRPQNHNRRF